jgi:hypothetical protein
MNDWDLWEDGNEGKEGREENESTIKECVAKELGQKGNMATWMNWELGEEERDE